MPLLLMPAQPCERLGAQLLAQGCGQLMLQNKAPACHGCGLQGLIGRASANAKTVWDFCAANPWIANLAEVPAIASTTSVCLKFTDPRIKDGAAFAKAVAKRIEKAGAGFDMGAYRDAPPGLRIWCGSTV